MNKHKKYKFAFKRAQTFLNKIVSEHPELDRSILDDHLNQKSDFNNISDAHKRLIESMSNRNMMSRVIGFDDKQKEMRSILFNYNPTKILINFKTHDDLLKAFKIKFKLKIVQSKRSLWRQFSEGIISGSQFMVSFKDKAAFDEFIKTFSLNKYTKAALPMLLSREIKGFGLALACDFLKELGYRDYPKPDVHLIEIFNELGLSPLEKPYEYKVYKSIIEMSEVVGKDAYTVDKTFWLICTGKFYLAKNKRGEIIKTGPKKKEFIQSVKSDLEKEIAAKR